MKGYLQAKGLNIQWERIRSALWKLDPEWMILRSVNSNIIHRRKYSVPGTLFLWHIDGNHKLIRWELVIYGVIDGYSRRIMYFYCSLNNRASTVLALYMEAVQNYGLPSKVRGDHGTENNFVAAFLESCNSGSFISGKSCHNQRIEWFWRDLLVGCTSVFYCVFMFLEENMHLEINTDIRMFALHYVFEPGINGHLKLFREGWDNHPISTERNSSPNQLWLYGLLNDCPMQYDHFDSIDWEGPIRTISTSHKFILSTKQKYCKSFIPSWPIAKFWRFWYLHRFRCSCESEQFFAFIRYTLKWISNTWHRCSCESEQFFAFIRYKLKWISNTWHLVYLMFESISPISNTCCAIKNAS